MPEWLRHWRLVSPEPDRYRIAPGRYIFRRVQFGPRWRKQLQHDPMPRQPECQGTSTSSRYDKFRRFGTAPRLLRRNADCRDIFRLTAKMNPPPQKKDALVPVIERPDKAHWGPPCLWGGV